MSKTPAPYNAGLCVVCQTERGEPHHPECPVGLVENAKLRAVIYRDKDGGNGPDYWDPEVFPSLDLAGEGWDVYSPKDPLPDQKLVDSFGRSLANEIACFSGHSLYGDRKVAPESGLPLEMVFLPPPSVREPVTKAYWEAHTKIITAREKLATRQKLEVLIRKTESEHSALADKYERDKPGLNDYGKALREQELIALAYQIIALRRDLDQLNKETDK